MAGDTIITIVGNLTADPDLRFTPAGVAVANFTVASTPRTFDRQSGQWNDGDALFLRCAIWREPAERVAESLSKGTRVIVTGRLKQRTWEKDGQTHDATELEAEEIGPSLRWATATVKRATRTTGNTAGNTTGSGGSFGAADDWATAPASTGGFANEPPF